MISYPDESGLLTAQGRGRLIAGSQLSVREEREKGAAVWAICARERDRERGKRAGAWPLGRSRAERRGKCARAGVDLGRGFAGLSWDQAGSFLFSSFFLHCFLFYFIFQSLF